MWYVFGVILVIALSIILFKVVYLPLHVANRAVETAYGVVDKTLNADNVIYNYEWFKRSYNSYKALKDKYVTAKSSVNQFLVDYPDKEKWDDKDKTEYSRLNTVAQSYQNQLNDAEAEYNARSSMANRSIFKTGDLPEKIGE